MESFVLVNAKTVMATRLELKVLLGSLDSTGDEDSQIQKAEEVFSKAFIEADRIENELTEYRETSPVFQLNHAAVGEWVQCGTDFFTVFSAAEKVFRLTDGAFDPGFRGDRALPFSERWELDHSLNRVRKKSADFTLSFGAIGKGYAVDRLSEILQRELGGAFVVNLGGSSLYLSAGVFGTPLEKFGWAWEKDEGGSDVGAELSPRFQRARAVGVSGIAERGNHILGRGRQNSGANTLSTFVSGESALFCDAFSTALFVLGWEEGYSRGDLIEPRMAIALMDHERVPFWNGVFSEEWSAPFTATGDEE